MKVEKFNSTKAVKLIYDIPYNYTLIFGENRIKVFFCNFFDIIRIGDNMEKKWIIKVFILTFVLSVCFSSITNVLTSSLNDVFLIIILLLVIGIGILFDIIGTSTMSANEASFHAIASKKISGAREAINMLKNKNKISSICNDIVGDVCGIISGGLGAVIAISLSTNTSLNNVIVSVLVSAFISSLTVGGKAIFKSISIKNADSIIFGVGKVKHFLRLK